MIRISLNEAQFKKLVNGEMVRIEPVLPRASGMETVEIALSDIGFGPIMEAVSEALHKDQPLCQHCGRTMTWEAGWWCADCCSEEKQAVPVAANERERVLRQLIAQWHSDRAKGTK